MHKARGGFTFIEVMVAVMIISVVVAAVFQMAANNSFKFSKARDDASMNQYASLLIANSEYGFKKESVTLDKLLKEFTLESDLRRRLRDTKVELSYTKVDVFDTSEIEDANASASPFVLEIGQSSIREKLSPTQDRSTALLRLQVQ